MWNLLLILFILTYCYRGNGQSSLPRAEAKSINNQKLFEVRSSDSIRKLDMNHTEPPVYSKPSLYPTSVPSSHPSTSSPSISIAPTTQLPTSIPTHYVKADFPTNLPTEKYHPPTSYPSAQPSRPTISPTTAIPTSSSASPTITPSTTPTTNSPTIAPSLMATPIGQLGKDWWYLLSAEAYLFSSVEGTFTSDDLQELIESLTSAFVFEFSDHLSISEIDSITVLVMSENNYQVSPFAHLRSVSFTDSSQNSTAKFHLKTWCPSHFIEEALSLRLQELQVNPESILSILHEQDFRDISAVQISAVKTSTTTIPPPATDSNLSPDRIIYIIIGTVIIFTIGAILINFCRQAGQVARAKPDSPSHSVIIDDSSVIDGDIMMTERTSKSPKSRSGSRSPLSSPTRSKANNDILSPIHESTTTVLGSGSDDKTSSHEDLFHNPIYSLQRVPTNHDEEEVFDFRFDQSGGRRKGQAGEDDLDDDFDDDFLESGLHSQTFRMSPNHKKSISNSKSAFGGSLTSSLSSLFGGGNRVEQSRSTPQQRQMSIQQSRSSSNNNSSGGLGNHRRRKEEKIDYESLVL